MGLIDIPPVIRAGFAAKQPMTHERFMAIVDAQFAECRATMVLKNADYTKGDVDPLFNFKEEARRYGLTPLQVWLVHFGKHMLAIEAFCQGNDLQSEDIAGRIKDAINYPCILRALIEDAKGEA